MVDLEEIQNYMRAQAVDAWLVYDFRGSNPIMWQLLGAKRRTTRRAFLLIPVAARPRLLCHAIEVDVFANLGVDIQQYRSWNEMCTLLQTALQDCGQVAMEYSPGAELPTMSWVDGGTLELVRSFGVQVVSSAALFQVGLTTWSAQALQSHRSACRQVVEVKDAAFDLVRSHLQGGAELSEFELQEFIVGEFARRQLDMDHRPIVGVNANSGNAHYEPTAAVCAPIVVGDWLLVDLWARHPGEENIFGDITWVG